MEKSARLSLRCTKEQKRIIEANGKKAGMGVSQYILQAALEKENESAAGKRQWASCFTLFQKELNELEHMIKLGMGYEELREQVKVIQGGVDKLWLLLK